MINFFFNKLFNIKKTTLNEMPISLDNWETDEDSDLKSIIEQIERIKNKIDLLRVNDSKRKVFGAETHKYLFNPVLKLEKIRKFEIEYAVKLPIEYVIFLTKIGNGGAGPFYGIKTLNESRFAFFDNSRKANHQYFDLSKAFPHTEKWNVETELEELYQKIEEASEAGNDELEEQLSEQKWELIGGAEHDYGRLNITDYGCGIKISLIVNGHEKGNMWIDDRTHDGGIYPTTELGNKGKIGFLDWYELWLDNSLGVRLGKSGQKGN